MRMRVGTQTSKRDMGFTKPEFLLVVILLQLLLHLHLRPHAHPLPNTSTTASDGAAIPDFYQEPNATDSRIGGDKEKSTKLTDIKRMISVGGRFSAGGGHGGGGHAGSHSFGGRARGGEASYNGNGRSKPNTNVIPYYAAGAMPHHQNNHQHHGSNQGNPNDIGPTNLVLGLLVVCLLKCLA